MRRWKKLFFGFTILSILHKIKKRNNKFGQMVIEGHNSKCISCSHFHLTFLSNLGELKFVGLGGKSPNPIFLLSIFSQPNNGNSYFPFHFLSNFSILLLVYPNPQTDIVQVKSSFEKVICLLCKFLLDSYYYHSTRTCDIFHSVVCFNLMTQFHL